MVKRWIVTGDTHSDMRRFQKLTPNEETGIIILGDAGCNYYKKNKSKKIKQQLEDTGVYYYLVRGNHEDRPENIAGMVELYDESVKNKILMEYEFPHIRYLKDGEIYYFGNHRTLVIGGAYSIDKDYRLSQGWAWFPEEQLTKEEMETITNKVKGQSFDFVFSHTCPRAWEPTDLFLSYIDQSKVDKSMEDWLDKLKEEIDYTVWLFGHFHADRFERYGVELFYTDTDDLEAIWNRWQGDPRELGWWYDTGPNFHKAR